MEFERRTLRTANPLPDRFKRFQNVSKLRRILMRVGGSNCDLQDSGFKTFQNCVSVSAGFISGKVQKKIGEIEEVLKK